MDKVPTSPPARSVTWMPVTRCSASTTLLSGSLPMSSATIDSTTWSLVRLIARLLISDALTPVTTTVGASVASVFSAAACAHTEALLSRPAAASTATPVFRTRRCFAWDWEVPVDSLFIRLLCYLFYSFAATSEIILGAGQKTNQSIFSGFRYQKKYHHRR